MLRFAQHDMSSGCLSISTSLKPYTVREIYLEGVSFLLTLVNHVFVNEDGSSGVLWYV